MSDYYITTEKSNTQQGGAMLHDDQSLRDALNAMSERHYMELVLRNKRARTLSPPLPTWRRESISSFQGKHCMMTLLVYQYKMTIFYSSPTTIF